MNNIQETLLFPVRDAEARRQFLFACLAVLAGFIIPIVPALLLTGYGARIMRQVLEERKGPSMPKWEESDWSTMLMDGLRLYGAQLVMVLPLFILIMFGVFSMIGGSVSMAIAADENMDGLIAPGILFFLIGMGFMMLISILSLPYGVIIGAVGPHVVAKHSFTAAFQFKEWWAVFRKALGQFILSYAIIMALSFAFIIVMQITLMTVVLMCIVPLLTIPYTAYLSLLTNTLYAQAYLAGKDTLELNATT